MEAVGTALWMIIATQAGGSGWAWGLSFVVISLAFPGYSFNGLTNFMGMLRGDQNMVRFIFSFVFHSFGAIAAHMLCPELGFGTPSLPVHVLQRTRQRRRHASWHLEHAHDRARLLARRRTFCLLPGATLQQLRELG